MKYPFSPEVLDALPEELAELFRALEVQLLEEICSRLKIAGELNEVTVEAIKALRSHGIDLEDIEKAIADATGSSREKLDKLLDDVVARNQAYFTDLIDKAKVTQPETFLDAEFIANIKAQTLDELTNITRSMGFLVQQGGKSVMMGPAKAYQWALDNAVVEINAGATSYNEAIKRAVTKLADSGIKTVSYESGHVDHVDVAVRRAVMTGVSQLSAKYVENSAEWLETPYFEVSAHSGARDKGVGPMNHKSWQGQVYSVNDGDIYPNIYAVCGLDTGPGLEGWNCRHRRYPFVEGVMERTYTDEQLRNIDPPPFKYQGKTYTAYEATQMQRKMERTVRQLTRREKAYKAAGLTDDARNMAARRRRLSKEYTDFSKAAGLPEQRERMKVYSTTDLKDLKEFAPLKEAKTRVEVIAKFSDRQYVVAKGAPTISGATDHYKQNLARKPDRAGLTPEAAQDIINNSKLVLYQTDRQTLKYIADTGYAVLNAENELVTAVPEKMRKKYRDYLEGENGKKS